MGKAPLHIAAAAFLLCALAVAVMCVVHEDGSVGDIEGNVVLEAVGAPAVRGEDAHWAQPEVTRAGTVLQANSEDIQQLQLRNNNKFHDTVRLETPGPGLPEANMFAATPSQQEIRQMKAALLRNAGKLQVPPTVFGGQEAEMAPSSRVAVDAQAAVKADTAKLAGDSKHLAAARSHQHEVAHETVVVAQGAVKADTARLTGDSKKLAAARAYQDKMEAAAAKAKAEEGPATAAAEATAATSAADRPKPSATAKAAPSAAPSAATSAAASESTAASILAAKVRRAMLKAKKHATRKAATLQITTAEAHLMVWKAETDAKQQTIEHTLHHSQREALRSAMQSVSACDIRQKAALQKKMEMEAQAKQDNDEEVVMMKKVNKATTSEAHTLWDMWQELKTTAKTSLVALQAAQDTAAEVEVKCSQAMAHRQHVEHLIARAGAHVEMVKATLLADYRQKKEQLLLNEAKATAAKAKAKADAKKASAAKALQMQAQAQHVVKTKKKQVAKDQERLLAKTKSIPSATHKVDKVQGLLNKANKDYYTSKAKVASLKESLNKAVSKVQSSTTADRKAAASELATVAKNLKAEGLRLVKFNKKKTAIEQQLNKQKTNLTYEKKKQGLANEDLAAAQHQIKKNKLTIDATKGLPNIVPLETTKAMVEAIPLALTSPITVMEGEGGEGMIPAQDTSMAPHRVWAPPRRTPSLRDPPAHPKGLLDEVLSEAAVEMETSPSPALGSVLREAKKAQRHNSEALQQALREAHSAEVKNAEIAHMVAQLDEAARAASLLTAEPQSEQEWEAVHHMAPASEFMTAEAFADEGRVSGAKAELLRHQDAAVRAQEDAAERAAAIRQTKSDTLRAGKEAGRRLIEAARAKHAADKLEKKAKDQARVAAFSGDATTKDAEVKLGAALMKQARRARREAQFRLARSKRSTKASVKKIQAHADAKAAASEAAKEAEKEAEKTKRARHGLIKARAARAMHAQSQTAQADI
jgi:hypothetical protein